MPEEARHSRAGLLIVPSLRDSAVSDFRPPALPCRAFDMPSLRDSARSPSSFPALPCRAFDYAVPTGLRAFGLVLPGTPVPGF